jgi:hypothetical protein
VPQEAGTEIFKPGDVSATIVELNITRDRAVLVCREHLSASGSGETNCRVAIDEHVNVRVDMAKD